MSFLLEPDVLISLATLTAMEVVLGIDNVVFIAILAGKLPPEQRERARRIGLAVALALRLVLLFAISWIMGLTAPLFAVAGVEFSGRDLILLGGGLFLIGKATHEIHAKLEGGYDGSLRHRPTASFGLVILQILILDLVFSLDSVITAVGMAQHLSVMVIAMVVAVAVMLVFAGRISDFVNRHPTMKILALSFLVLIGVMLLVEGMGEHVGKGYIYFAMAFSLVIELLNLRMRRTNQPVRLHEPHEVEADHDRARARLP